MNQGDLETARQLFLQAQDHFNAAGRDRGIAASTDNYALVESALGNIALARRLFKQSVRVYARLGDKLGLASSLNNLASAELRLAKFSSASKHAKMSTTLYTELEYPWGVGSGNYLLAEIELAKGACERAASIVGSCLDTFRALGDRQSVAGCLIVMARCLVSMGRPEQAILACSAADRLRHEIGATIFPADREHHEKLVASCQLALGAAFGDCWRRGRALSLDEIARICLGRTRTG